MPILTTAFVNLIGACVGLVFNHYGRSWLGRQMRSSV